MNLKVIVCAATVLATSAFPASAVTRAQLAAKAEQLAMTMLPTNKLNQAAGFFGPVTKKYLPKFQQFQDEYVTAKDKLPVIRKYMPQAQAALKEAEQMKVPAKYEAEKNEYLGMFRAFLLTMRFTLAACSK